MNSLLVPVVVLDKGGQSLAGLGAANFTVEDEREAQENNWIQSSQKHTE